MNTIHPSNAPTVHSAKLITVGDTDSSLVIKDPLDEFRPFNKEKAQKGQILWKLREMSLTALTLAAATLYRDRRSRSKTRAERETGDSWEAETETATSTHVYLRSCSHSITQTARLTDLDFSVWAIFWYWKY